MADKKFSQFTAGSTNQVPTDELVGLDLSLSTANQNTRWTLNNLFSTITRNITDGALRFGGFAAPAVSGAGAGAIYFDSASNLFRVSVNGGAYTNLGDLTGSFGAPGQVAYASASKVLTGSAGLTFDAATSALTLGTSALPGGLRLVGTSGTYWNVASQNPAANKTLYLPNSTTPTTGNFLFVGTAGAQTQTDWSTGLTWSNSTNQLTVTASNNNQIGFAVQNTSAGTAAESVLGFTANGGAISLLSLTGTGFTTAGLYRANQLYWRGTTGITEMLFALDDASTAFKFGVNNAVAASINATATEGLVLGIASSLTGRIKLFNSAGATFTQISAGNAAASLNYILPAVSPTAGQVLQAGAPSGGNVTLSWAAGGGGGTPGGSDTQLQYNNAGAFAGISTLTTDGSVLTMTRDNISNTSTDGIILQNTTAAAAGIQQWSPRARFTSQGWRTASGGSSMPVDFIAELQTVQGTSVPTGNLVISTQVNNGGYTPRFTFGSTGTLTVDQALVAPQISAGVAATTTGQITLFNAGGSTSTSLQAGNAASSLIYRLPTVDPTSGQVLSASAPSGGVVTLSWQSVAGGTGNPGGIGSELQFRSNATTFGGLTGSSVSGNDLTLPGLITQNVNPTGNTGGYLVRSVPANDVLAAPFADAYSSFNNGFGQTRKDLAWTFGYNVGVNGTRVNTSEHAFSWTIESFYRTSEGTDQTEFYYTFVKSDGTSHRPFSIDGFHASGATQVAVNSNVFLIGTQASDAALYRFTTSASPTFTIQNGAKLVISTNGTDVISQGGLPLVYSSGGYVGIAPTVSGVRVAAEVVAANYNIYFGALDGGGNGITLRADNSSLYHGNAAGNIRRVLLENSDISYNLTGSLTLNSPAAPFFTTPLTVNAPGNSSQPAVIIRKNAASSANLLQFNNPSNAATGGFDQVNSNQTTRFISHSTGNGSPIVGVYNPSATGLWISLTDTGLNFGNATTFQPDTELNRAAAGGGLVVTRFSGASKTTPGFQVTAPTSLNGPHFLAQGGVTPDTNADYFRGTALDTTLRFRATAGGGVWVQPDATTQGVQIRPTAAQSVNAFEVLNTTGDLMAGIAIGTGALALSNRGTAAAAVADQVSFYVQDAAAGDAQAFAINEAGQIARLTGTVKRLDQNFARNVDTRAEVAGSNTAGSLVFNVEAGRQYTFRAILHIDADVTGGVSIGLGGTATATSFIAQFCSWNNGSGANAGITRLTSFGGGTGFAGVTNLGVIIEGSIVVNAAGTINVQFGQNTASGTSTVLAGSSFTIAQA